MSTRLSREGRRTVLWLGGEHDIATAWRVADVLSRAIVLDEADVVVDLSEVEFIGSSIIGILGRARTFLLARNRTLSIRAPSRSATRVIGILRLDALIDRPAAAHELEPPVAQSA